jgi:hypothetical protein
MEAFNQFELEDPELYASVQKKILLELRQKIRQINLEKEKALIEEKKAQKDREQNSRVIKKIGKPAMTKIWAKSQKKKEVKVDKYGEDDKDFITYGLKVLVDLKEQEKKIGKV